MLTYSLAFFIFVILCLHCVSFNSFLVGFAANITLKIFIYSVFDC